MIEIFDRSRCLGAGVCALGATLLLGLGTSAAVAPSGSRVKRCGDVPANHPQGGVYKITAAGTSCRVARGVAVRWYYRGEHHPFGYRCTTQRVAHGWRARCGTRGRVVRFTYYLAP